MSLVSSGPAVMPIVFFVLAANTFQFVAFGDELIEGTSANVAGACFGADEQDTKDKLQKFAFFLVSPLGFAIYSGISNIFGSGGSDEETKQGLRACIGAIADTVGAGIETLFNFATFNIEGAPGWLRTLVGGTLSAATSYIVVPLLIDIGKIIADLVPFT